jgi:hypothetical protein
MTILYLMLDDFLSHMILQTFTVPLNNFYNVVYFCVKTTNCNRKTSFYIIYA